MLEHVSESLPMTLHDTRFIPRQMYVYFWLSGAQSVLTPRCCASGGLPMNRIAFTPVCA